MFCPSLLLHAVYSVRIGGSCLVIINLGARMMTYYLLITQSREARVRAPLQTYVSVSMISYRAIVYSIGVYINLDPLRHEWVRRARKLTNHHGASAPGPMRRASCDVCSLVAINSYSAP